MSQIDKIHFTKMHGAGNDYIYVDSSLFNIADPSAAAIAWSNRHKGIGADGLVLIGKPETTDGIEPQADFTMRIFNADGSEARMCGNASRCIGKYVYEKGLTKKTEICLQTLSGIKVLQLHLKDGHVDSVTVDMGEPCLADSELFSPAEGLPGGIFVSMGNPHYVIFTDDVDKVTEVGPLLECHASFPERCNIELGRRGEGSCDEIAAHEEGRERREEGGGRREEGGERRDEGKAVIRTRVWERGSGVTMACGTGACATAVAAMLTGRAGRRCRIVMDGGTLDIEWREADNHVYLTGPAEFCFEGEMAN